jgi:hypothetical protein
MTAWTDHHLDFGNHTIYSPEGAQAGLKRWLQNSKCDVLTFIRRLEADYDNEMSYMRILAPIVFTVDGFLARGIQIVTPYVLWKQHRELKAAREIVADARTITPCTGSFSSVCGIPYRPKLF